MSETAYNLTVGDFNSIIFSDGCLVDKTPHGAQIYGLNCIYIDAGDRKLLVDSGCGEWFMTDTAGHLVKNMKAAGIKPEDIDTVIFSHGHIDHVCGTFDKKGKPVFPNAHYIITRKEWDYIKSPPGDNEIQNAFYSPARLYLLPLENRFTLVEPDYEVLPGIKMIPAHGHTLGNVMIDITSKGKRLLCIGDIIHSPREFTDPTCLAAFDVAPAEAVKTRAKILTQLAKEGTFVFACHFTFPGLGYIRQVKGVFSWESI
jgi:glyoxylase-like metal-dependent hydrolase (beta-lactamase superfamily II)